MATYVAGPPPKDTLIVDIAPYPKSAYGDAFGVTARANGKVWHFDGRRMSLEEAVDLIRDCFNYRHRTVAEIAAHGWEEKR